MYSYVCVCMYVRIYQLISICEGSTLQIDYCMYVYVCVCVCVYVFMCGYRYVKEASLQIDSTYVCMMCV
jgi:hypothetical protein